MCYTYVHLENEAEIIHFPLVIFKKKLETIVFDYCQNTTGIYMF